MHKTSSANAAEVQCNERRSRKGTHALLGGHGTNLRKRGPAGCQAPQAGRGKALRADAKRLTDGELLAKLRSFGIEIDRAWLERNCEQALSAEEIADPLSTSARQPAAMESDWIWICVAALWRRWFPDQPSFEELDDKMQAGYELLKTSGAVAACRIWLEAWNDVLRLLDKAGLESIEEFDERFRGTQSLFNWIQDLEDELWNAGLDDRQFLSARIALCEEGLRRFPSDDDLMTRKPAARAWRNRTSSWARLEKAEALYRDWLARRSVLGMGLDRLVGLLPIHAHRAGGSGRVRTDSAGRVCRRRSQGPRRYADRLADVCEEQGRDEEAKEFRRQSRATYRGGFTDRELGRQGATPKEPGQLRRRGAAPQRAVERGGDAA